jgi:hypothetical protein
VSAPDLIPVALGALSGEGVYLVVKRRRGILRALTSIVKKPDPLYKLTSHGRLNRYCWDRCETPEKREAYVRNAYKGLNLGPDGYHWTVGRWERHWHWIEEGKIVPAGVEQERDSPNIIVYFYEHVTPVEPAKPEPLPVTLKGDDERWAALYANLPGAFWLAPDFDPMSLSRGEPWRHASALIEKSKPATMQVLLDMTPSERMSELHRRLNASRGVR